MKGREGDAPLGDAFTARSHRIATLDSHHRPAHTTNHTRETNTLFHTTQRQMCQTQPGQTQKKKEHPARRRHKGNEAAISRTGERKKWIPTDTTSGDQLAEEAVNLGRCQASQSTDCFQQRCVARAVADAPMRSSALWQRRHSSKRLSTRRHARATAKACPPHRVTRSGLAEAAHLDLTPCESMESRAKKIFHDSVEHTHTEQDAYTRRQGAISNSGRFDTNAMPHLHHHCLPASRSRRVQDIPPIKGHPAEASSTTTSVASESTGESEIHVPARYFWC